MVSLSGADNLETTATSVGIVKSLRLSAKSAGAD